MTPPTFDIQNYQIERYFTIFPIQEASYRVFRKSRKVPSQNIASPHGYRPMSSKYLNVVKHSKHLRSKNQNYKPITEQKARKLDALRRSCADFPNKWSA
ncbi:hypothetical protein CEXT_136761 [Caerostris extrusa]|uniref:Uncharacterized protein n=1 Tax=Caerostris extrusa TaxID=172846 RepID=A0AAV4XCZ7_CAEEX|nr:hypothetical protein CEXT_136761 [Caerostris extrusa]